MKCINCNGDMHGDGYTSIIECENHESTDESQFAAPDEGPFYCEDTDQKIKDQIDKMDYESMLRLWRFADTGNSMLQGVAGKHFAERMQSIKPDNHVAISKHIGWEK